MGAAEAVFQKALLLLDRGESGRGEELLRNALGLAEQQRDGLTLVRALCCLGELLHDLGRDPDALPLLERVSAVEREDDLLDYEVNRAKELLAEIAAK
jgi:hypothetical protein